MSASVAERRGARPFLGGWHLVLPLVAFAAWRDLWAPDEPRYAQIAREAWESGSLLVLHICGDLYPDKPPLVYWLSALGGAIGGWSEFALRVPSILATIGSAWIAQRIARRLFGDAVAAWTPTFYLGTAMVLWFGGRLQLDPLLALFCLAAVDLAWRDGGAPRRRDLELVLAGLCAGLAALCKGPVAWLFVGCALVAMRCVPTAARASTTARRSAWAWAGFVALAILPVATWATAAASREPALWRALFLDQHVGRATSADAPHSGPPWEHAWQMPALLLPWTPLVAIGLVLAFRAWRAARASGTPVDAKTRGLVRALAWVVPLFLVFSIMPPKRELYLLPIYPAAAWFGAVAFERALASGRLAAWASYSTTGLMLALSVGAATLPRLVDDARPYAAAALPIALACGASAVAAFVFLRRGRLARWADSIGLGLSAAGVAAAIWIVPLVDPAKSARDLALEVAALDEDPSEIPCFGVQPEGYRYYADVPTVRGTESDWTVAPQREGAAFLALVGERQWNDAAPELRERFRVVLRRKVGSRDVLVIGAPP